MADITTESFDGGCSAPLYYKLVDRKPVPCGLFEAFRGNRVIRQHRPKDCFVSTVFLVIDHGWNGELVLFETMIFGGKYDMFQRRYTTYENALVGHYDAIIMAKGCKDKRRKWRHRRNKRLLRWEKWGA